MSEGEEPKYAYVTLLTSSSYLAGVVILAYTLRQHNCKYPLIVLYTDGVDDTSLSSLQQESLISDLILQKTESLVPAGDVVYISDRFIDTWTKLRVFSLVEYDKLCYLDADMTIRGDMDVIFDTTLPDSDWIVANHTCVCNLDKDPWCPDDWNAENCAFSHVSHPSALTEPTPVTPSSRPTFHLFNSGVFLFEPHEELWTKMEDNFYHNPKLATYKLPDQDFLNDFFLHKFKSIGWQYNAIKTMRYWHPDMWRDSEVLGLHYIVDKPWTKRVGEDGVAGYLGRDGVTHTWWWSDFEDWCADRISRGMGETVEAVKQYVAAPPTSPLDGGKHSEITIPAHG